MTDRPNGNRGKGRGIRFLRGLIDHDGDECVIWPLFRDVNGYGRVGYDGKKPGWAHRVMCELAHGQPPEGHEAAHTCGGGKQGCVNPKHLTWKTKTQNQLDRAAHGTKNTFAWAHSSKLTAEQVVAIRALAGRATQREIAEMFDVTDATVRDITSGKTWRGITVSKIA